MNLVNCDQCKKNFPIQPKEKKHGQGIKEIYFVCTHCKTRYTAYVTDQEVRRMQRQIRKLEKESLFTKDNNKRLILNSKINRLKEDVLKKMDTLKAKVCKSVH